tara:strand:- start:260 stop:388 length:129 start_codon:yes stop_codon:yes gene_type:complete
MVFSLGDAGSRKALLDKSTVGRRGFLALRCELGIATQFFVLV